jgi:hypothetical protein
MSRKLKPILAQSVKVLARKRKYSKPKLTTIGCGVFTGAARPSYRTGMR